ncbi:hypothetical protein BJB45_15415 [Halomonas huangheensis]|uniref:Uncharacterized protein n=1 Tax=Halomonas huangheensis TaxID=1178482 RepID=W1NBT2_9GAMM|nr:hypothetical protein AR456_11240 [Halomonas huangheensis]ERL52666.1 hypothetical protein BJB45_15415 [Halomonas huangheensis]
MIDHKGSRVTSRLVSTDGCQAAEGVAGSGMSTEALRGKTALTGGVFDTGAIGCWELLVVENIALSASMWKVQLPEAIRWVSGRVVIKAAFYCELW